MAVSLAFKLQSIFLGDNTRETNPRQKRRKKNGPREDRTPDPLIKSQLLYQLS